MIIVHGIKNCDSVKKALKFLKENHIEYTFRDFKEQSVTCDEINEWLKYTSLEKIFNSKSTTYKTFNLKALNLTDQEKIEWLCRENLLIKRPVLQHNGVTIVGYNKDQYEMELL